MTKKHFEHMASIVKAILDGKWTNKAPAWARQAIVYASDYERAVATAEAFIILSREFNPRFDEQRFLQACGLVEKPARKRSKA